MQCRTWTELFEEYEKATFARVARSRENFGLPRVTELETLNKEIARTLHELREHETVHHCHS